MGATKERTITVPHPFAVVTAAAEQALRAIGAQLELSAHDQGTFKARTGATIWSLAEQIEVHVQQISPASCSLRVSSSMSQLIDWGKNTQNLQQFERALAGVLAAASGEPERTVLPRPGPPPAPKPPAAAVHRVFISYRRDDSGTIVGRICDRLANDVGAENVFKDVDNIPFGVDFAEYLDREVQKCTVLFAVIGPRWLQAAGDGPRRLDDPSDFVRIEIGSALRRGIPVVPLLVDGARIPKADDLPEELKPLARRNGTEIRHDPDFHGDITRLLSRLG